MTLAISAFALVLVILAAAQQIANALDRLTRAIREQRKP
jgi:hypothetical protein